MTMRTPVVDFSCNRYHIVSSKPYKPAALLLNVLWSPEFPGATMDPSILLVGLVPSIIHTHTTHWFWNDPSDTASAVPPRIASLICDVSPCIFNLNASQSPVWFVPAGCTMVAELLGWGSGLCLSPWELLSLLVVPLMLSAARGIVLYWILFLPLHGMLETSIVLGTCHVMWFPFLFDGIVCFWPGGSTSQAGSPLLYSICRVG